MECLLSQYLGTIKIQNDIDMKSKYDVAEIAHRNILSKNKHIYQVTCTNGKIRVTHVLIYKITHAPHPLSLQNNTCSPPPSHYKITHAPHPSPLTMLTKTKKQIFFTLTPKHGWWTLKSSPDHLYRQKSQYLSQVWRHLYEQRAERRLM